MSKNIDELLIKAVNDGASDLHVSVGTPPLFRVNGKLSPYGSDPLTPRETEQMVQKLLSDKLSEFEKDGELDFAYHIENSARFRVNVFKQKGYMSIAARVIPSDIPSIEKLSMPKVLYNISLKPQGLILVTGPTGSGKTTTLAAMVDYINRNANKHIVTLEDPIEYIHTHNKSVVQQREVGVDTKHFATGLRAALRQDPDVILVGEMRDLETISTAITAAETGHLVLATLHTNSAVQTVNRIIDAFPAEQQAQIRIQLASVLEAVISQRLFVRKDIRGRIAATEILLKHPSVSNLIRSEKIDQINNIIQTSKSLGMHSLPMSINELVGSGKIDYEEALPYLNKIGDM